MGNEKASKEDNPIQDDKDTGSIVHEIEEEDGAEEDNKSVKVDDVSIKGGNNEDESRRNDKPQVEPEESAPPRSSAFQKLDCALNVKH